MGLTEESTRLFRELMGFASPLGLFSEMVDPDSGAALGNYPQAFTHIGLILAARDCGHASKGG
jgi:GH15 family glucan-1,4-alpha-glucosidase